MGASVANTETGQEVLIQYIAQDNGSISISTE